MREYPYNVIALGAGVQSTTMLLMAMHGEFEIKPDCAIFADTGWESKATYEYLCWLVSISTIPIYRVSKGNIKEDALNGKRFASMPLHLRTKNGHGMLRRQCTREYKIVPIEKKIRELMGVKRLDYRTKIELWLGISYDERIRMKVNPNRNIINRYPLVENFLTRSDCIEWLQKNNYPVPPKSACLGCPFHDNTTWARIKKETPEDWEEVCKFDKAIRTLPRIKGEVFLHSSLKPLDEVEFADNQLSLGFISECSGHCGV